MDKTKLIKWLNDHKEEVKLSLALMGRGNLFIHIDPKRTMQYETDKLENFINELALDELKRTVKGRDWYYLAEWQGTRQKVKEELFL